MATELKEVALVKPHTHAGRQYQPGQIISVTKTEAQFLLNNKIISRIPAAPMRTKNSLGDE